MRSVAIAAVVLVLGAAALPTGAAADPSSAAIVAVYPDPVSTGDRGEFVVVRSGPAPVTFSDSETTVRVNASGPVALVAAPAAVRNLTDHPVRAVPDLQLSNAGETLILRRNRSVVARLTYGDTEEGELRERDGWRPSSPTPPRSRSRSCGARTAGSCSRATRSPRGALALSWRIRFEG